MDDLYRKIAPKNNNQSKTIIILQYSDLTTFFQYFYYRYLLFFTDIFHIFVLHLYHSGTNAKSQSEVM